MAKWKQRTNSFGKVFGYWLAKDAKGEAGISYMMGIEVGTNKGEFKRNETAIVVSATHDFKFMLRGDHRRQLAKRGLKGALKYWLASRSKLLWHNDKAAAQSYLKSNTIPVEYRRTE
jgi:hypothetical protein